MTIAQHMQFGRNTIVRVGVVAALLLCGAGPASGATIYFSATRLYGVDPEGLLRPPVGTATPSRGIPAANPDAVPLVVGGSLTVELDLELTQTLGQIISRPDTSCR